MIYSDLIKMLGKVKLIGYGSLINKDSLNRTIKTHSGFKKVWVHGFKRVFDLKSVKHLYEPWDTDVAVLNVGKCKGAKFNAVIHEVTNRQIQNLLKREKTYELTKVKYSNYDNPKTGGDAFLFVGMEQFIYKNLNPRTHYFHLCRKGAYSISKKFGEDWDKTTFLANGKRISNLGKHLIQLNMYNKIKVPYSEKL